MSNGNHRPGVWPADPLHHCACGECDPSVLNLNLYNCMSCGYLARSIPKEDDPEGGVFPHECPVCRRDYWLRHEEWSRQNDHWRKTVASS